MKKNKEEPHDCKENWIEGELHIECKICGVLQSEYYDAHNCYEHEENGFCGWCGKDLRTNFDD